MLDVKFKVNGKEINIFLSMGQIVPSSMSYNAMGVTKYNCHSIKCNNICC